MNKATQRAFVLILAGALVLSALIPVIMALMQ
jgi:hypothetical protein